MRCLKILLSLAFVIACHQVHAQCSPVPVLCDANDDLVVDQNDIDELILTKGTVVGPGDRRDPDMDGVISTMDARDCVTSCAEGSCQVPALLGPMLPANEAQLYPAYLAQRGYQSQEFILADIATSYTSALPLPTDGKLELTANSETIAGDFNTRVLVLRPIDPRDFDGRVVVEWLNVSAGIDANPNWIMSHNALIRSGSAWVGVSAQAVGVNALLNSASPTAVRYDSLLHPGDSYSYDIFSKAGELAGEPSATLLDGLTADVLIATGESQSAMRLVTYIDGVHPLNSIFDGFYVHSRFGMGGPISQSPLPYIPFPHPSPVRDDLNVPVLIVQAEGDVIGSNLQSRQPAASALVREWEMAGTAHADSYTLLGINDPGDGSMTEIMFNLMRGPSNPFNCVNGFNAGPHWLIVQAAHRALDVWIRTSTPPPAPPRLTVVSASPVRLLRDADGNAKGGLRSPHVDVPIATLDVENAATPGGFPFCGLFGRTIPLTAQRLFELYPTKADFVRQWSDAIHAAVAGGFLLFEDGEDLKAAANAWTFPN
ncbi:MAG: hypothetical protein HRT77_01350 [Halioglobus sp.]|nr:hypothetical protein [Halioglobus sp.]